MSRSRWIVVAVVIIAALLSAWWFVNESRARRIRQALFDELQPVALKNCTLTRYGGPADGGYVMCGNLIAGVESAYSYGIDREDNWGCQLSTTFQVTVHQYDCFTPHRPTCNGGQYVFHDECVGNKATTIDRNAFDTLPAQIARNADAGKRLIVKMDVEGAEWESLLATPDEVLARIDQMPMELHGTNDARFLEVVRKLKRQFHLVNLHFNNWACTSDTAPFPARAYQVLWVNKRLAEVDPTVPAPAPMSAANAPDNPGSPDCQLATGR